jgi:hypothetical protein
MIRASDLTGANASLWARPAVAPRSESRDAGWFGAGISADVRVAGDLNAAARGLNVEQHAARILSHLCGDEDAGR